MKIAIACGGSGGHIFPGLAVAQALYEHGHKILLLVSEKEIDSITLQVHPEFRFEKLLSTSLPSPLSPTVIQFLWHAWKNLIRCHEIFRRYQPKVVLSMGGFASTISVIVARMAGIPSYIHEANSIPGRANRLGAKFASRILLGFEECKTFFPKVECVVTGTPIRNTLTKRIAREQALTTLRLDPLRKTLLVIGGSQGSLGINQLFFRAAPLLRNMPLQIIHLTGAQEGAHLAINNNYLRENIPAYVVAFHHHMEQAFSCADLVISRAGASSLSEIAYFGLASILIPYPFATDNHQASNASIFVRATAAEMLLEPYTTPEILAQLIANLLNDECRRQHMAQQAKKVLFSHEATQRIVDIIERGHDYYK